VSNLEELKSRFLVTNSLSEAKMVSLLELAVDHCAVDANGNVEIKSPALSVKDKIMLVLAARFVAHHLDETVLAEVKVDELARNTSIACEQVRARASDLAKARQIEVVDRGVYRALLHKLEAFLKGLPH
jgi:hypothetical protein